MFAIRMDIAQVLPLLIVRYVVHELLRNIKIKWLQHAVFFSSISLFYASAYRYACHLGSTHSHKTHIYTANFNLR